ncbi:LuxR C-terminal-related transcriptional regulator [Paraburkholderia susongensis]|uniref:LuxR family transcriptional regulator, maltose regulon positive regulatory protein n=1 Tax=Paraburkholderia susongensis TaxID=1515439 RepID=A0A1X7HYE8_9BURK|nr:LuxR C-terminal-related transcriptional regulator [Paraburkholderia susongensis]SMG07007.1 LuxR family transcriptional regulator, maltose regulon positive regulatory protein [Paraburkholderia susongensis]
MQVIDVIAPARPSLLLATKLLPPRMPRGLIDRPRLIDLAALAEDKRLTVIKAPAGFGKTSLALAWLDQLRTSGAHVAWLSLDTDDDEPARFLHHLAQALRHACGNIGASAIGLTADASLVPAQSIVATLINELVEVDEEVYLFLDDYHLINLPVIHEVVAFFIEHMPSHVHVVVCTRVDSTLPLARLRARNELLEIDAAALRFNFEETQSFIERECRGKPDASTIKSLFASTEGWAAALRISASVLARKDHPPGAESGTPSGASRPFAAYLEDMLKHLPAEMVEFMLRTAILDRLSASLCAAVTGVGNSQGMLEAIAERQLLLEPMDVEGHWFRYHHLMRDYLCQRLETQHRDEVADVHRRACQWYAQQEQWTDAVRHAIAAGATDDAISLMGRCAMALVTKGDLLTLLGWQRQFPAHLMRGQVQVRLAIAWGMALALRFDDALAMLDALAHDTASGADTDHIRWECEAIHAVLAALQDDPQRALAMAQACLARPSTDVWTTNVVSNVVRFGHWKAGNLEALYATPWVPYSIEEDQRNVFSSVYRLCLLGHTEMQQMHFVLAERYFMESMHLAERYSGPQSISAALCAPMIAQIRYEQGRLDEAEALLLDLMPIVDLAVLLDSVLIAYRLLIRIAVARSNSAHAYVLLDRAQTLGYQRGWRRLVAAALVERTRLHISEGRMAEASACVSQLDGLAGEDTQSSPPVSAEIDNYRALATACVAMAQGRTDAAVEDLSAARHSAESRHVDYLALRLRTTLALAWMNAGKVHEAIEVFGEVVKIAACTGLYQSILDQGPEIGPLLQAVRDATRNTAQTKDVANYIDRLLDGWRALYQPGSASARERDAERESLSARERDIVGLIAQGLSNKEIARNLGIAPETVKSHVKSIFVKLAVDKRAHAVARAQALGLLGNS